MFHSHAAKLTSTERIGTPRLPILAVFLGTAVVGYLLTVNVTAAFGFLGLLVLFCIASQQPAVLLPPLVILPVVMEATLQSVSVTVGGRPLLNYYGVVNVGLAAAVVFFMLTGRIRPYDSLVTGAFVLYFAAAVLSLVFSADKLMTLRSLVRISSGFFLYLMITQFLTEKRQIDRLFQIVVIVSAIPIAVGLYQIAIRNHFALSRTLRIRGTLINGMSYGMYLAMILPFLLGQVFSAQGGWLKRSLFASLFFAGLVNLVYASTRIGWGVFALTMILYGLLTDARRLLPVILIAMMLAVLLFSPFFVKSFGGFFATDWRTYFSNDIRWDARSAEYVTASSLHIRVYVWRHMLGQLLATNPLFGVGSGTWFLNFDLKTVGFPIASHSDYFEVLFGTGFIGLLFYLLFRLRQLILLGRFARSRAERDVKTTVLFPALASHIACLAMSITEVWQSYACIYWLSWIMIGISECYYRWSLQDEPDPIAPVTIPPDVLYN